MPYREPTPPRTAPSADLERRQLVKRLRILSTVWLVLALPIGGALWSDVWWLVAITSAATIAAMGYTSIVIAQVQRYARAEEARVLEERIAQRERQERDLMIDEEVLNAETLARLHQTTARMAAGMAAQQRELLRQRAAMNADLLQRVSLEQERGRLDVDALRTLLERHEVDKRRAAAGLAPLSDDDRETDAY